MLDISLNGLLADKSQNQSIYFEIAKKKKKKKKAQRLFYGGLVQLHLVQLCLLIRCRRMAENGFAPPP